MKYWDPKLIDFQKKMHIIIGERGAGRLHWENTHPELMERLKNDNKN